MSSQKSFSPAKAASRRLAAAAAGVASAVPSASSAVPGSASSSSSGASPASASSSGRAWWALQERLYRETVERQLRLAEKRAERRAQLREDRARAFGDLCEASEGRAVVWRREGVSSEKLTAFADAIGDTWLKQTLVRWLRLSATREIDRERHAERRASYYERERERRRELAKERRKIRRRSTVNPCPTKEQILSAWLKVRESDADLIRFGSLMEDLECYVDNSLRRDETGEIIGRNGGIKEWLHENIPVLYLRYTTVMRYKSAARKLRQLAGLADPTPAAWIVEGESAAGEGADSGKRAETGGGRDGGREKATTARTRFEDKEATRGNGRAETGSQGRNNGNEITVRTKLLGGGDVRGSGAIRWDGEGIARAREVYRRLVTPPPASRTAFLARLDRSL